MKQNNDWTPLIVLIIILAMVWGAFELGVQATIEECNRRDELGYYVYRDSFVCHTKYGERII